jgi:hypothetical protein
MASHIVLYSASQKCVFQILYLSTVLLNLNHKIEDIPYEGGFFRVSHKHLVITRQKIGSTYNTIAGRTLLNRAGRIEPDIQLVALEQRCQPNVL